MEEGPHWFNPARAEPSPLGVLRAKGDNQGSSMDGKEEYRNGLI